MLTSLFLLGVYVGTTSVKEGSGVLRLNEPKEKNRGPAVLATSAPTDLTLTLEETTDNPNPTTLHEPERPKGSHDTAPRQGHGTKGDSTATPAAVPLQLRDIGFQRGVGYNLNKNNKQKNWRNHTQGRNFLCDF